MNIEDNESVYFWDHEGEPSDPNYDNMYFLSDSLEEFIDSLKPDEDGEDW